MRARSFFFAITPLCVSCGAPGAAPETPAIEPSELGAATVATDWELHDAAALPEPATVEASAPVAAKETTEAKPVADGQPRIGIIGEHVRIFPKPSFEGLALGSMRIGTSVRLRGSEPIQGGDCRRGWYPVEPRGYVCLNDRTTLDLEDPYFKALSDLAPRRGVVWPYRYAHSRGAPMYSRVPSPEEWESAERHLGPPGSYAELGEWAKGHEELIEKDRKIEATDPVPWYFEGGVRRVKGGVRDPNRLLWKIIPNGSMLAYGRAFEMHGRVWLVTADLTIVPADRVQYMRRSQFHGVELGSDVMLPLAWNRSKQERPLYRREGDRIVPSDETIAPKSWRMITGQTATDGKNRFFELRDRPGMFIRDDKDTTVSRPRDSLPQSVKEGEKWIEARISPGTIIAYEGSTPVYATLFSPGKGGHPVKGHEHEHSKYATTQIGHFRYEWKEWVATMSNEKGEPKVLWFTDVPHIQYIKAPLAQHVSFWHEDFGNPKSAECVNLSALDGRWMFGFTDPPLPEDWNGVGPGRGNGKSTPIIIYGL